MWTNDFDDFCPICDDITNQQSFNDNDDTHVVCLQCENELPLPKIREGEPFLFGSNVYTIHIGSDDEMSIERYGEK